MTTYAGIGGIPIAQVHINAVVEELLDAAARGDCGRAYRLVNAYTIALASEDPSYHRLLREQGVNLPDGRPLAIVLRRRGFTEVTQVRGPSLFNACLDAGRAKGTRHFFLGGSADALSELQAVALRRFPGVTIAGADAPPFRPLTDTERRAQDARIRLARPDIVWVGLGTPKQDFEAQRISDELGLCAVGVGAAFDFLAGTKPETPAILRRLGLEWLFRLASEPRRLWRRYLFGNLRFIMVLLGERRGRG